MSSEPVCEISKKMLDLEQRSVIKFLSKEGKKPKEILERSSEPVCEVSKKLLDLEQR